jgi:PAS domain S-box-containing protein
MSGRKNTGSREPQEERRGGRDASRFADVPNSPVSPRPPAPELPARKDPIAWAIALLGVFVAGCTVWWISRLGDASLSSHSTGVAAVPGGVVLIMMASRLRRTERLDQRTRLAWSIVTAAVVGYAIGALIHFGEGSVPVLGVVWPVSLALELATYPLLAIALELLPKRARTRYDTVLFTLDVAIVAWSAAMLIWHFLIYPVALEAGQDLLAAGGAALFPVADLTLVFAIIAIVIRGIRESTRAALIVAGVSLALIFLADMIAGYETLRSVYTPGGPSGVLYSTAWLGLALAAYLQWRIKDSGRPTAGLADYARSFPWLPYAALAVAFVAPALRDWNDLDMFRQHVPATGLLIVLVVARLWVTARQGASVAAVQREHLAAAVDQAAEAILTTDRSGHVTYVNRAFTNMTGYPASEIVGRNPDLLRYLGATESIEDMTAALLRGESWAGRLELKRVDGATIDIDMTVAPLHEAGGAIFGTVAVARDISHERALEARLAQAQRMEAVGRLAGGIAHDFNNILTAISGFGELASAELPSDHPVAADIDQILKASDRAAALTRDLLAFGRRQVMQSRLVDLNDVLGGLTPMLSRLIGEDVQLIFRPDPRLGLTMADSSQLEQVVVNLAVNARDAMRSGGTLTITTANEDVDAAYARTHVGALPGPYVALVVRDTGVGMTPAVMEHAFEPFFTTKERGKGTGLGLSTAVGIVEQSHGFVHVESEPGVGSVFTVYLPRAEGVARPEETGRSGDVPLGGDETILIAEDEDAVRGFVERVLTGAGYRVVTASHGAEALAVARKLERLDLLFTDVVMPGMSGVQLAAALAKTRPGLPVVYASGYSEEGALRGVGDGGIPYLPKPFNAEALLTRIREVLDRRTAAEATAAEATAAEATAAEATAAEATAAEATAAEAEHTPEVERAPESNLPE